MASSIPFATLTILCPFLMKGAANFAVDLTNGEATENTIKSGSFNTSSRSFVTITCFGRLAPGRFTKFVLFVFNASTSWDNLDHKATSCPLFANKIDNAVPHVPAPKILTFIRFPPFFPLSLPFAQSYFLFYF